MQQRRTKSKRWCDGGVQKKKKSYKTFIKGTQNEPWRQKERPRSNNRYKDVGKMYVARTLRKHLRGTSVFLNQGSKQRVWADTMCKVLMTFGGHRFDFRSGSAMFLEALQNHSEKIIMVNRSTHFRLWVDGSNRFQNAHTTNIMKVHTGAPRADPVNIEQVQENTLNPSGLGITLVI